MTGPVQSKGWQLLVLVAALVVATIVSLKIGQYDISTAHVMRILAGLLAPDSDAAIPSIETTIVLHVRAPRVVLAMLAGCGLALSGAVLQGIFRNPLVGPQVVGVSNGAAFGAVLAILVSLPTYGIVGFAFLFGLLALFSVFGLHRASGGQGTVTLILAGVVVGAFFAALVGAGQYLADPESKLPGIVYWLLGSFASANPPKVWLLSGLTLFAGGALILLRWRINLLSLDDQDAAALGVRVVPLRAAVLVLVSLLIAGQVAVSGGIGWVGLVVPHFARMIVGPDHRVLLPASAILGALYLLSIDDLARSISTHEIPIGVLTALIGTPVFAYLLWRTGARGWSHV